MTRIKYKKLPGTNIYRSVRKFTDPRHGGTYEVDLDLDNMIYKVRNINTRVLIRSTQKDGVTPPTHTNTLKRQAKKALKTLNIQFKNEVRISNG